MAEIKINQCRIYGVGEPEEVDSRACLVLVYTPSSMLKVLIDETPHPLNSVVGEGNLTKSLGRDGVLREGERLVFLESLVVPSVHNLGATATRLKNYYHGVERRVNDVTQYASFRTEEPDARALARDFKFIYELLTLPSGGNS